jgi:hypothetical protein
VYNIASGVEMKEVTEDDDESKIDRNNSDSDGYSSSSKESDKDIEDSLDPMKDKEITGMQLIWEDDYILMVCCDSRSIYVYDEDDTE